MNKWMLYAFADEASAQIDEQTVAMQRNSLNGLEIRNADGVNVSDLKAEKAREIRGKMDDAGLEVWSVGSPIGKIDIVKDDFQAHLKKFRHTLDVADILGAKNIRMFSFYIPSGHKPEEFKGKVFDQIGAMIEAAAGRGIDLCHENEKGIYGDIAKRCLDIHKALPDIKGIFDPANFIQCGQDTLEAWDMLQSYIRYLHIKDALQDGKVVPAGKGIGNVPAIVASYMSQGGNAVTIEPHLAVFQGLAELEREGEKTNVEEYVYANNNEAFDAACQALKQIL